DVYKRQPFRLLDVQPTALFPKQKDGQLRQLAWLRVASIAPAAVAGTLDVNLGGRALPSLPVTLVPGESRLELLLPAVSTPTELAVEMRFEGETAPLVWRGEWQPARQWKVYLLKASHYDLGYDGRIDVMQRDAADYLDLARRLCTDHDQYHDWHYHIEHLGFLRAYERERGPQALVAFVEGYLKTGKMTLMGNPSGPHFHWMDYEQLARLPYPARRHLRDRFGLDVTGIAVPDNPSVSWPGYQILAQGGFRHLIKQKTYFRGPGRIAQSPRNPFQLGLPPIAWMTGPDQTSRILTSFHGSYSEQFNLGSGGGYGAAFIDSAALDATNYLEQLARGEVRGPYPYDAVIISNYVDWEVPHEAERAIASWREKFDYPKIQFENAFGALAYLEEKYGAVIPEIRGDTANNSADYSSIDPKAQGEKRETTRLLAFAESLHVLAASRDPEIFAPLTWGFEEAYQTLVEFDEHCWPTMLSVNDQNVFNTVVVKQHGLGRARAFVDQAIARAEQTLLGKNEYPASVPERLAVWNSLAHPRSGIAEYPLPVQALNQRAYHIVEETTGTIVPAEYTPEGKLRFHADVPALGYAVYRLALGSVSLPSAFEVVAREDELAVILHNRWYRLEVSRADGAVRSLRSLVLDRELLDVKAQFSFNTFIRCHAPALFSADLTLKRIGHSTVRVQDQGPISAAVEIITKDNELDVEIVTTLRLFAEEDRLEVINDVRRMGFLHTTKADRYRENVFVAFPFAVPAASFRVEQGPGTLDPAKDLAPGSNTDFVMANRWIDVANADFGITLSPREAACFHCGQINYNQFGPKFKATNSHLFNYVWSNRMAGLTHLSAGSYQATLSYSLRAHAGDWRAGQAADFGWRQALPALVSACAAETPNRLSVLSVDAPNVQLSVLKRSAAPGRGNIVRLVETEGRPTTRVRLGLTGLPCAQATLCDLVENDLSPLPVQGNTVEFDLAAYAFATIRLEGPAEALHAIAELSVQRTTDASIHLAWRTVDDRPAAGFHIFRSEVHAEAPSQRTLVGYTTDREFVDRDLNPGTDYTYRVAVAAADNRQGPASAPLRTATGINNTTPPRPLVEVGVVPLPSKRLWLYWQRSAERDLALYRVHRSSTPDFMPTAETLVAEVPPAREFYVTYRDENVAPGETWFYRVLPVDFAAHEQRTSLCVSGTLPHRL
ncbi:MAG: fibronectin type III domain-containing protein, partial [Opitutus sp.]|nr:fibronectin type III domain-containing protein [Opitutus sp.]